MLTTLVILLCGATVAVPLTRRAGFGSGLGYLLAGIAIGPAGLGLITNVDAISSIASLGVVMLLFLIGLELRPQRLWVMRRAVFGLGTLHLAASGAALAALAHLAGMAWPGATVLGAGFAMSSTAIVLPMLAERDLLTSPSGRVTFAVLLFQDIGGAKTPEVFTTVALLIVAGTAFIATQAGLSPSLGAFMAGVLLSES